MKSRLKKGRGKDEKKQRYKKKDKVVQRRARGKESKLIKGKWQKGRIKVTEEK